MATKKTTRSKKKAVVKRSAAAKKTRKVAKKVVKTKATKRTTRPQKRPGSPQTRRMVGEIGKRILAFCKGHTPNEVAEKLESLIINNPAVVNDLI